MHTAPAKTQAQQALSPAILASVVFPLLSTPPHDRMRSDLTPIAWKIKGGLVSDEILAKTIIGEEGMHGASWHRWTGTR